MLHASSVTVATAGWSIDSRYIDEFPEGGTHLERYGRRLKGVEINSSFHRPHRRATYERWARSTPPTFRFSVKMPKSISHESGLASCEDQLERFFDEVSGLGEKLNVLLLQLPPKFTFDDVVFGRFLDEVSKRSDILVALEPRHASWFTEGADERLKQRRVARVAADPARGPGGGEPGGWMGLAYFRWHGSPRVYYSGYNPSKIAFATRMLAAGLHLQQPAWFVFDNTAAGAALGDALALSSNLQLVPRGLGQVD